MSVVRYFCLNRTSLIALLLVLATMLPSVIIADTTSVESQLVDSNVVTESTSLDEDSLSAGTVDKAPLYPISAERKAKLYSYSRFKSTWRFVEFFLGLGIMALFLFTGLSAKLRNWAGVAKNKFFTVWLFLILFIAIDYLLNFPFAVYRGFVVESQYGFMNQTFMEWLGESLKGLGLTAAIGIIPMWFLYKLINSMKNWWLWFSVGSIPFIVFFMIVIPIFIMPMFNTFEPLKDKQLESELLTLASKAGIEDPDLFQVNGSKQSTKVNAYVTGMFNSKRIVLYDTLIDNFSIDEIKFVMGHEMGHYVMNHIWYGLSLAIFLVGFSLWLMNKFIHTIIERYKHRFKFDRLGDIASLPLVLVTVTIISFMLDPISNGFSRYQEHQADIYGMEITNISGESAAIAFDKLSVLNLSDPDPNPVVEFWFYDHPALKKRIEFVRSYRR